MEFMLHNTVDLEGVQTSERLNVDQKKYNLEVDGSDHIRGIKWLPCPIIATRNTHKKCITNHTFSFLEGNVCHQVLEITHIENGQLYEKGKWLGTSYKLDDDSTFKIALT
jgi:hypothetical protein